MNYSMINSAAALNGLQQRLDLIGNNIANMNTAGYKRRDASFQDILTTYRQQETDMQLPGRLTPLGMPEGSGSRMSYISIDFGQGVLVPSDNPLDFAIEGNALFEFSIPRINGEGEPELDPAGNPLYDTGWMRQGAFQLTALAGDTEHLYIATDDGTILHNGPGNSAIPIPQEYNRLVVDEYGRIQAYNAQGESFNAGQLKVAKVLNPGLLIGIGEHRYAIADDVDINSVVQRLTTPDDFAENKVAVRQAYIEQSNVDMSKEMTDLMMVQRAYQLSARALMSADSMMNMTNNLRG